MLDYMKEHSRGDQSILYTIAGHEVCEVCFTLVYGIRHNRFQVMKSKFLDGVVLVEHGRTLTTCMTDPTIRVVNWL